MTEDHEDSRRLAGLLAGYAEAVRSLAAALPDAFDRQWSPASVRSAPDLDYADPTGETAVDPRRLALRARVIESERAIEEATATIRATEDRLRHAVDRCVGRT